MGYKIINLKDIYNNLGEERTKEILSEYKCELNQDVEYFLKEKAIEFGIKKKDILVENKAMTTWENMKLSRELMIKNNLLGECTNIAIVTSSFHMRRSIMIAERVFRDDGVNIVSLPGEDNSTRRTTWFTNEKGRVRAIGEVEKIIDYVKQGKIDDFEII